MRVRITIDGGTATATLDGNQTPGAFAALLPLKLTLSDYGSVEKIGCLPRRLAIDDAPSGFSLSTGDIAFYAP